MADVCCGFLCLDCGCSAASTRRTSGPARRTRATTTSCTATHRYVRMCFKACLPLHDPSHSRTHCHHPYDPDS